MGGLDNDIDRTIIELLKLKDYDYVGIDVRIRKDGTTTFWVAAKEEHLSDSIIEEDVERLKEKLELLKKIDAMMKKLKKYDTDYTPYILPYRPWDVNPWPVNPWQSPFWCVTSSNSIDEENFW